MLELNHIFADFQKLPLSERVSYLETLEKLDLGYNINYENLKRAWTRLAAKKTDINEETE